MTELAYNDGRVVRTVDDIFSDVSCSLNFSGGIVRGDRGSDLFSRSQPLPVWYSGEYRPVPPSVEKAAGGSVEGVVKNSKSFDDYLGGCIPVSSGYGGSFEEVVKRYYSSDNEKLKSHLAGRGRRFYNLERFGTDDLGEGVAAAVAVYGDRAALIGSKNFEKEVSRLSSVYSRLLGKHVSRELVGRYIMDHEHVHAGQRGMDLGTFDAERDVERTLVSFYNKMVQKDPANADMYSTLADIAGLREAEVFSNYIGHRGFLDKPAGKAVNCFPYSKTA